MDQQTKQELLRRHRARLRETIAPDESWGDGDPVARMITCWIIDIVADARELELKSVMATLAGREPDRQDQLSKRNPVAMKLPEPPQYQPLRPDPRRTYDPKDVEVTIGDGIGDGTGDPRKVEGFAMTTELAGSIERASVTYFDKTVEQVTEDIGALLGTVAVKPDTEAGQ